MISEDFKNFFASSDPAVQQRIVSDLLALSTESATLDDGLQARAVSCSHCGGGQVLTNGRLMSVERYVRKG